MRKVLTVFLCLVLAVLFVGCDFTSNDVNNIVDNYFENYEKMGKTETGTYSNFKNINVQSSYLGYGYDLINDSYMNVNNIKVSYPIIDMQKIDTVSLLMQKVNKGDLDEVEGSTMEEFYQGYAASLNLYGKAGKSFSGGLKADFSSNISEKTFCHFYKRSYFFDAFYIHITNTVDELQSVLSEDFKNALKTLPVEQLFARYGTHLIKEASMGGRIEESVTYSSTSIGNKSEMSTAVNMHIKAFGTSVNGEASANANAALEQAGVKYTTKITQTGGKAVSLSGNIDYEQWVSSFDESLEFATLCGVVGDNSLVGIWELLPSGNEARKAEIENAFVQFSGDKYDELCAMFKLPTSSDSPAVDTSWKVITKNLDRMSVQDGTKYDASKINTDQSTLDRHNGWELGALKFYGLEENDGTYVVKNKNDFSVKYNVLKNMDSLPLTSEITYYHVNSDLDDGIINTTVTSVVGKGAYWIRITYSDDTQTHVSKVNCLDGKTQGAYIEFLSADDIDFNKALKQVEIVFVYELLCGAPGTILDWDGWDYAANFRCEYVLNF